MPRRREIRNKTDSELYSIEVYEPFFFNNFDPSREFEKWAAIEVSEYETVPADMETLTVPGGNYAVFLYKGPASKGAEAYQYIFGSWLPQSDFMLDNRPHFAIMGEKYKNEDPESEEEIWIPVKPQFIQDFIPPELGHQK
jgi:AraC family transcriptional regulator